MGFGIVNFMTIILLKTKQNKTITKQTSKEKNKQTKKQHLNWKSSSRENVKSVLRKISVALTYTKGIDESHHN